jgi:hypothetical protein
MCHCSRKTYIVALLIAGILSRFQLCQEAMQSKTALNNISRPAESDIYPLAPDGVE